jgi:hypothetical protein
MRNMDPKGDCEVLMKAIYCNEYVMQYLQIIQNCLNSVNIRVLLNGTVVNTNKFTSIKVNTHIWFTNTPTCLDLIHTILRECLLANVSYGMNIIKL